MWVVTADEWELFGDEVVVRRGSDFHRLVGEAAAVWLEIVHAGSPSGPLLGDLKALGLITPA